MKKFNVSISLATLLLFSTHSNANNLNDNERDDVLLIGDSIFALSGEILDDLEYKANQEFRDYALSGAKFSSGIFVKPVTKQFEQAQKDTPSTKIKTVLMDGGGNDILIPAILGDLYGCKTYWWRPEPTKRCKRISDNLYVEIVEFMNNLGSNGTDNIVYLGYYHTKGDLTNLKKSIDYGMVNLERACTDTASTQCHFIDPRNSITPDDILSDNIHPNTSGSLKISNLIWPVLKDLI
ncbi:SGNH/GDSL hydrolase family protein [Photobacterium angustum]|uniref:SGNH/GDSL hydrolase family protein n=1 Tax=Photobacterium angustum TaxID=661 RepID=UPI003D0A9F33